MKKYILAFAVLLCTIMACNNKEESKSGSATTSSIKLPYQAYYATDFTNNISDSDLLLVLNSYKYWENGDYKSLRSTLGDSVYAYMADGFKFAGPADSLMNTWKKSRDSLSSVVIRMDVWLKNHSVKDSADFINVWYKETDTYKSGKVDSANYEDDNGLKNGKIIEFSSHKQVLK